MKEEFIKALSCPCCSNSSFSLKIKKRNSIEIRDGELKCNNCNNIYSIKKGVVYLLYNAPDIVIKEQKAHLIDKNKKLWEQPDTLIRNHKKEFLSLPDDNGNNIFKKDGYFKNVASHSDIFYETLEKINIGTKTKILDIGADRCWSTNKLAEKGADCVALDINHNLYNYPDLYINNNNIYFERIIADMCKIPIKANYFDIVLPTASLHHSWNLQQTMNEITRILKPGGRLVLVAEAMVGIFQFKKKKNFAQKEKNSGLNENTYTLFEWQSKIYKAGLKPKIIFISKGLNNKIKRKLKEKKYRKWYYRFTLNILKKNSGKILLKLFFPLFKYLVPFNIVIIGGKKTPFKKKILS